MEAEVAGCGKLRSTTQSARGLRPLGFVTRFLAVTVSPKPQLFCNSLPNHVVDVNSVNVFKARLDRFWMDQDVKYDFTADLTGTGDRSVNVISET